MIEDTPLLEMRQIKKSFSGVDVLKGVDFTVRKGEIHSLMGANGAGKSTLIKILTGLYPADSGDIYIGGKKIQISGRQDAINAGISVIYQELSLIPTLSVTENIFLGQEKVTGIRLNRKEMKKRVQQMIDECQFSVKPDDIIENLSVAQQQTVEIMKALLNEAKLIIMDEPTASLNTRESESLFQIIRNLRKNGTSIIYISHRLEEVYEMSDRLTILRDGVVVAVLDRQDIEPLKVVNAMLGHSLKTSESHTAPRSSSSDSVLEIRHVSTKKTLKDISFNACGGQILGIGGLVGSGRTDLLKCIFGLMHYRNGEIKLNGKPIPQNCRQAIKKGVGLVPEDRRTEGLVLQLNMTDNIALPNYPIHSHRGIVNPLFLKHQAQKAVKRLLIHPADEEIKCGNLSGGNQQKVVLAKWIEREPEVLLVDEPTVGIDVGAKAEIYDILREHANAGKIILVVSSDIEELLKISDRILILYNGQVFKDMKNEGVTANDVMLASSGIDQEGETA